MDICPPLTRAEHRGGYRVYVEFGDGTCGTIDPEPWLYGSVFNALKEEDYFARLFVDGGTVAWPNGADIAPETLYRTAKARGA